MMCGDTGKGEGELRGVSESDSEAVDEGSKTKGRRLPGV